LAKIKRGSNLLISVANRWILGWPERVQTLIDQGEFWTALKSQTEMEFEALVEAELDKDRKNLSPWEITEQAGLDPAPPIP